MDRLCRFCGGSLAARGANALYCSDRCYRSWHRIDHRDAPNPEEDPDTLILIERRVLADATFATATCRCPEGPIRWVDEDDGSRYCLRCARPLAPDVLSSAA